MSAPVQDAASEPVILSESPRKGMLFDTEAYDMLEASDSLATNRAIKCFDLSYDLID